MHTYVSRIGGCEVGIVVVGSTEVLIPVLFSESLSNDV